MVGWAYLREILPRPSVEQKLWPPQNNYLTDERNTKELPLINSIYHLIFTSEHPRHSESTPSGY